MTAIGMMRVLLIPVFLFCTGSTGSVPSPKFDSLLVAVVMTTVVEWVVDTGVCGVLSVGDKSVDNR